MFAVEHQLQWWNQRGDRIEPPHTTPFTGIMYRYEIANCCCQQIIAKEQKTS